jgi:hypothetical protein
MVVTSNNRSWIAWLDLLTPSFTITLNFNQFTITLNTSWAKFWSDLFWSEWRLCSILVRLLLSSPGSVFYCDWFGSVLLYERLSIYESLTSDLRMNYLHGRLYRLAVSQEMSVAWSYPWTRLLVPQQRAVFQESTTSIPVSMDTFV